MKWKEIFNNYSQDELIVLGLVLTIFVSIYFTVAGVIVATGYLIKQNRLKMILSSVGGAYYIVAFCALSLLVSLCFDNTMGLFIAIGMFLIFIISMYIRTVMTRSLFEKVVDLSITASIFPFVIAIMQQLFLSGNDQYRVVGTFLNANYYATMIEFVVLFCVYRLIWQHDKKERIRTIGIMGMNGLGLYLCDSRTAIFALFAGIYLILFLNKKIKPANIFAAACVVFVGVMYLLPNVFPRLDNMSSDLQIRMSIWSTSIKGIMQNPLFGEGGGTYAQIYQQYGGHSAPHAHNLFLDPILNFGIVGVVLIGLYLKENFKYIHKMYYVREDQKRFYLIAAVMLCVVLHGITDITVFGIQTGLLLTVILSIAGINENRPMPSNVTFYELLYGQKISHSQKPDIR